MVFSIEKKPNDKHSQVYRHSNSGCGRSKECAEGISPHPLSFLFLYLPLALPPSLTTSLTPQAPPSLTHLAAVEQVYKPRQGSGCLACMSLGSGCGVHSFLCWFKQIYWHGYEKTLFVELILFILKVSQTTRVDKSALQYKKTVKYYCWHVHNAAVYNKLYFIILLSTIYLNIWIIFVLRFLLSNTIPRLQQIFVASFFYNDNKVFWFWQHNSPAE